jgi:4-amino-4-deoxy-L-arabinose transferase-like glycosyltransferase
MVREYIAHHLLENPLRFAENYYVHYPKVAIGHWPPLFYCAEAIWTLVFGASRATLLLLILLLDALLVLCVYRVARDCAGAIPAFLAGLVMIGPPFLRKAAFTVEPDMMLALLAFLATMVCGRRLEAKRPALSLFFILLCAACVLTHGRGIVIAFMPLVATLLMNPKAFSVRHWLLILAAFGAAIGLAILIGQSHLISIATVFENAALFPSRVGNALSWPVLLIAAVGAWWSVRNRTYRAVAMASLVLSLWILLTVLSSGVHSRYLIMIAPAIAVLFASGLRVSGLSLRACGHCGRLRRWG